MKVLVAVLLCIVYTCVALPNNRPTIGIITQPYTSNIINGPQYVPASYIKYLESGGARVVPIRYGLPADELSLIAKSINGLFLPGGGGGFQVPSPFYTTLTSLWSYALQQNDQGTYFPVWGTCFGFELLNILVSGDVNILGHFDSENYTVPLKFTAEAKTSRLFGLDSKWRAGDAFVTPNIVHALESRPITMNNHQAGVSPQTFTGNAKLSEFFTPLSTNVDRKGNVFISSFESKVKSAHGFEYPIYGTQYHPEKPIFEWDPNEVIQHTTDAVFANQYHSNFFVRETRENDHTWGANEKELIDKYLIYNWNPVYAGKGDPEFEQIYVFDHPK